MASGCTLILVGPDKSWAGVRRIFTAAGKIVSVKDPVQLLPACDKIKGGTVLVIDYDACRSLHARLTGILDEFRRLIPTAAIVIAASRRHSRHVRSLLSLGINFYVRKPLDPDDLRITLHNAINACAVMVKDVGLMQNMRELTERIDSIGYVDFLTKCYNYRYFARRLEEEMSRRDRLKKPLALAMFDINAFSGINEIYGNDMGDIVLSQLAMLIKSSTRSHDVVCRTGGEEFSVVLASTTMDNARQFVARILEEVATTRFGTNKETLQITVSAGIAGAAAGDTKATAASLTSQAKKALQISKAKKGSAVTVYKKGTGPVSPSPETRELKAQIANLNQRVNQGLIEMIYGFAKIIEAKDAYTGQHVEDTQSLAERVARELDLSEDEIQDIRHAAILHDLGKVGIEEQVLQKPGKLTDREFERIKKHPVIAAEILKSIHALREALPAIRHHHERYDGQGYPDRLKGKKIPLGARIVSVADVYQALTSDRPYRKAFSKEKALEIIRKESGKQFDPVVVNAFIKIIDRTSGKKKKHDRRS